MIQAVLWSFYLLASGKFIRQLIGTKAHSLWLSILLSLISYPALSQNIVTINRNVASKSVILSGKSGGSMKAKQIAHTENTATGYCDGYVNSQPNHLLKIESWFEFLRLEVQSPADTTILVAGSSGVWCNDDSGSANPMIEGQWHAGLYKVWIGSYQPNTSHNYQIRLTGNNK